MHTATLVVRYKINIDQLIIIANEGLKNGKKKVERRKISTIDVGELNRSSRTGFGKKRYKNTDIRYPLLITTNNELLDGRHRLCRLADMGRTYVNVIVMDDDEIDSTRL